MKTIYKYNLLIADNQGIYLPKNAKILCAKNQREDIVLYVEIDTAVSGEDEDYITFIIIGTGHKLPDLDLKYIDTVLTFRGALACHVYREIK
jgi:hypothetical protein